MKPDIGRPAESIADIAAQCGRRRGGGAAAIGHNRNLIGVTPSLETDPLILNRDPVDITNEIAGDGPQLKSRYRKFKMLRLKTQKQTLEMSEHEHLPNLAANDKSAVGKQIRNYCLTNR